MAYFPMFVDLENRPCLVVGGGAVAARKCGGLLAFGADVTAVAERFCEAFDPQGKSRRIARRFQASDLTEADWTLVVAATDDRRVNGEIAARCRERNVPVNVADCREECTFFFPAYCLKENIAVGVTTSGESPALASRLRKRLDTALPAWLGELGKETDGYE